MRRRGCNISYQTGRNGPGAAGTPHTDEDQFAAIFKFTAFNHPTRRISQNGYGGFNGYSVEVLKENYLKEVVRAVVMVDGQLVLDSEQRITDVRISTLSGFEKKVPPIEVSQLAQVDEVDLRAYDTYFPTSFEELKKELKNEEYFFVQFRAPGKVEGVMTVVCRVKLGSTPTVDTAEFAELSSKPLDKNGLKAAIEKVKHFLPYK